MPIEQLILFFLLVLIAEVIGTVGGFGSSVMFVPVAGFFFDIQTVLGITAIFHVSSNIAKISLFKSMYKLGWSQFLPFVVTVIAILLTDLLKGIGIGMAVSIFFILRNNYKKAYHFNEAGTPDKRQITIQLVEDVTFINKGAITLTLDKLPNDAKVVIDGSKSRFIDIDVLEIIHNFKETALLKGIQLELKGIPEFQGVAGH